VSSVSLWWLTYIPITTELSMRGGAPPSMKKLIFEVS
jgi:hypothetical protein